MGIDVQDFGCTNRQRSCAPDGAQVDYAVVHRIELLVRISTVDVIPTVVTLLDQMPVKLDRVAQQRIGILRQPLTVARISVSPPRRNGDLTT